MDNWLIIVLILLGFGLFKYLTREKCTKCKSTNFIEVSHQYIKSFTKNEKTGSKMVNRGIDSYNVPTYTTVQYDEYLINYQCNDCNNKWTKRKMEKV